MMLEFKRLTEGLNFIIIFVFKNFNPEWKP
jgi:hypothetical protein